jgi:hypothetical protein
VFVRFTYAGAANDTDNDAVLAEIEASIHAAEEKVGRVPHWAGLRSGSIWLVKGRPWREVCSAPVVMSSRVAYCHEQDLRRFPSLILRVTFEGPDVAEEALYDLLRVSCPASISRRRH